MSVLLWRNSAHDIRLTYASMHVHSAPRLFMDTGNTMHHNRLQTMTIDSITCKSRAFCERDQVWAGRPGADTDTGAANMQVLHVQMLQQ